MPILPLEFYRMPDTLSIARELLGKYLVTEIDGELTSGKIVETEAYLGTTDRACHASNGRRTTRTETMYLPGGHAYVYLIYGIYDLFNVVTHQEDEPHAVLIRAIEPADGLEIMMSRRGLKKQTTRLTAGPGVLTKALGITRDHSGHLMNASPIWIEDRNYLVESESIVHSARVGVDYAGEDAHLPYRFRIAENPWTSPAK
jgi:DNA-3-methyladenine glycosylase